MNTVRLINMTFYIALCLMITSCSQSAREDRRQAASPDRMRQEAKEAYEATKEYTLAKKEEYRRKIQAELRELDRKIDALQAKAKRSGSKTQAESEKEVQELKPKREAARRSLDNLESATEKTWDRLKRGADTAMAELRQAYDKIADRF